MRIAFSALLLVLAGCWLRADPADVEGSHDYPGFPRMTGFVITDFDEDNPATFDFPVARPLPTDSSHVEPVQVTGHRYIIRYELGNGFTPQSLFQTQDYYERMAGAAGFTVVKSGAQGDVTETFRRARGGHETWVYLNPGTSVNMLTVVEALGPVQVPAPVGVAASDEDSLYVALIKKGRVVLPLTFLPSKPDVDAEARPLIGRMVRILQAHPELRLSIEGHTDNRGDPDDNQRLSAARARSVRALLVAGGVDPNRLVSVGLGGSDPIASDNTSEGRQQNRRIELVLLR